VVITFDCEIQGVAHKGTAIRKDEIFGHGIRVELFSIDGKELNSIKFACIPQFDDYDGCQSKDMQELVDHVVWLLENRFTLKGLEAARSARMQLSCPLNWPEDKAPTWTIVDRHGHAIVAPVTSSATPLRMGHIGFDEIDKPLVLLHGAEGLGVILLWPSGVVYGTQAGGEDNRIPSEEGVYVPLERFAPAEPGKYNYVPLADQLRAHFVRSNSLSYSGIDNDDADAIDAILKNNYTSSFLKVDRKRLDISMNGWVYADVGKHPDRHPSSGTTHDEQWNYWLYGFGAVSGVLTW
jgi:hypothetical protein